MKLTITEDIYKALLAVSPVVSKDAFRPQISKVFVHSDGNTVELVATDGHRMHRALVYTKQPACTGLLSAETLKAQAKQIKQGIKLSVKNRSDAPLLHTIELTAHTPGTEQTYFNFQRLALQASTLKPMLDFSGDAVYLAEAFECAAKIDKTESAFFTMPANENAPCTVGLATDTISFNALIMPRRRAVSTEQKRKAS